VLATPESTRRNRQADRSRGRRSEVSSRAIAAPKCGGRPWLTCGLLQAGVTLLTEMRSGARC
jgi:hypothetical protein